MEKLKTQLLILGGGPGGYVSAIRAGRLGIKTTLVERHKVGGVCLNYGCIPSKALLGKTALLQALKKGKRFGLSAENVNLDFKRLSQFKNQVVGGLVKGIETILNDAGVDIIFQEGKFKDEHILELATGQHLEFAQAIIATGSHNKELPGLEVDGKYIIDSSGALALEEVPASLLVVGAGAIGLEMGLIFHRLGAEVTVVELMPEILPGMDKELAGILRNILTKEGLQFNIGSQVESIQKSPEGFSQVKISGSAERMKYQKILVAVGRSPNVEALSNLDLNYSKGKFIETDDWMNTSIPNIKAVGDVAGMPLLAHKASHQGLMAVEDFAGIPEKGLLPPVPGAVFTEPEFASVGFTLENAEQEGLSAKEYLFPLQAVPRARAMGVAEGAFKVVTDERGKLIGVHILAPEAGELLAEASLALSLGLSVEDITHNIHIHPTLSEGLLEACLLAKGSKIHI
jgi:dihydrolipoamide dehydrogenase